MNKTAALIIRACDGKNTVQAIVERLAETADGHSRKRIERDVIVFLDKLTEKALINWSDKKGSPVANVTG